ncbi:MAG: hypothetical protein ACRD45_21745 [Bryobacteraceae bacterium]
MFATLAYAVVKFTSCYPNRTFLLITVVALAISFALPVHLSFTKSKHFAGVTNSAQMVLVLMHTVLATSAVTVLTRSPEVDSAVVRGTVQEQIVMQYSSKTGTQMKAAEDWRKAVYPDRSWLVAMCLPIT